jgi:hypothetical protein
VLTLITAPVSIIIRNQQDAAFCFLAFSINFCSLFTLALVFIPKMKHVYKYSTEDDLQNYNEVDEVKKYEKYEELMKEKQSLVVKILKVNFKFKL